jgi:hypothetical protein
VKVIGDGLVHLLDAAELLGEITHVFSLVLKNPGTLV